MARWRPNRQQSVFADIVQEAPPLDLMDRWQWMANKLSANELQDAASLMWASWACRNKILFEQESPDFTLMASGFVRLSHDYCSYANKVFMPYVKRNINSPRVWEGPPTGCVKINTDAYVIQNVACGLGAVFRDDRGELLVTAAKRTEAYSAEIAEAMAVRYGIQIAQKMGFQNIVVESDAWNVVNNIGVHKSGMTPIFLIFEDIKKSKSAFNSFSIGHVRRTGNKVAHLVARWELQIRSEHICMGSFPHNVKALADLDYR